MVDPGETFGLFVSCVDGQPVTRFGSRVLIGADRDPEQPQKIRYAPDAIVAIPHGEARKYAREYQRAIADGSLTERTADEWSEQNQPREAGAPLDEPSPDEPAGETSA